MASDPEEVHPSPEIDEEDEDGGGPVKSFLEHLEDLRWTLIKAVASLVVAMVVCLVAGNKLVTFLTWPLRLAQDRWMTVGLDKNVTVRMGTNTAWRLPLNYFEPLGSSIATNRSFRIEPVLLGTNLVLTLEPEPAAVSEKIVSTISLKNYSPLSAFIVALKLALYGGLVLASPFIIYFLGEFILPALKITEKRILFRIAGFGSGLFVLGVFFCYFIIAQVALMASVQFSEWMGFEANEWRAEDYISFVTKFMLGMGLSFQLPVVLLTLVKIELLDYQKLSGFRSYWVVINMVLCAVITPSGDPVTMMLMALPLQVLYEVSVFIARIWARQERAALSANNSPPHAD
ncbi:MAG TPA: twin-arginine translocase subunit TatC [Candidatus Paceibacterota bacterium]|nr:twin-arginine translocase subunit TatC [Verrucomicrobiota bacterium]HRZ46450.1 twin-arginine translocase subunit TatC [Candidatus Paceibacterota bacterium]HRZ94310.1 twin-arginine translocase subunit TatC [Candidatus Paceibacterota bacterium]